MRGVSLHKILCYKWHQRFLQQLEESSVVRLFHNAVSEGWTKDLNYSDCEVEVRRMWCSKKGDKMFAKGNLWKTMKYMRIEIGNVYSIQGKV